VLIEPLVEARPHIEAIARRFPRVEHVEAAAAREAGRLMLNVHRDMARTSRHWESDYVASGVSAREVEAVTIDAVRLERRIEGPILLKIDVQGAELDVLEGATETLSDTEYVVLETSLFQFFEGAPLFAEVVSFMAKRDFVAYDVLAIQYRPLDGAVSMLDLAFVKEAGPLRATHRFQLHPLL
jgi:FkbM family methyltransferase